MWAMLLITGATDGQARCSAISLLEIVCYLPTVHSALEKKTFFFFFASALGYRLQDFQEKSSYPRGDVMFILGP